MPGQLFTIEEAEDAGLIHRHPTGSSTGFVYSTAQPILFSTGQEPSDQIHSDKPVGAKEATQLTARLAKLYPSQLSDEQGKLVSEQLRGFPRGKVRWIISNYRTSHDRFSISEFFGALRGTA